MSFSFLLAGDADQISKCCYVVARVMLCCKTDSELREQLYEVTAKDGLMGPKTPPAQAAGAWVRLWLGCSEVEREAVLMMLTARTRLQVGFSVRLCTHAYLDTVAHSARRCIVVVLQSLAHRQRKC